MSKPEGSATVVLVHGAFADASSWAPVIADLRASGVSAVAPANPLRGVAADAAYIASFVSQIEGPVVLVGHSYGGAVVTVAGAATENVTALVYVAAFIPDVGESLGEINARFADMPLGAALRPGAFPLSTPGETSVELSIAPELFPSVFAADVPAEVLGQAAYSQRPAAVSAFEEKAQAAAWKNLPSWTVVATSDLCIDPAAERSMAERAGSQTIEVDASHAIALSQPRAVADLIRSALAGA